MVRGVLDRSGQAQFSELSHVAAGFKACPDYPHNEVYLAIRRPCPDAVKEGRQRVHVTPGTEFSTGNDKAPW